MTGIFKTIKEKVIRYFEVNMNLFKLDLISGSSRILSYFIFTFTCLLVLLCIFLFLGFGFNEVFYDMGLSRAGSFFLTGGLYSVFLIVLFLLRGPIVRFFRNIFIDVLTGNDESPKVDEKSDNE